MEATATIVQTRGATRSAPARALIPRDRAPVPRAPGPSLPQRLDAARRELAAAGDDFRRLQIRDSAAAIKAAADVLDRRDVAVLAAELVCDCEREIARANPVRRTGPKTEAEFVAPGATNSGGVLDRKTRSKLRRAHELSDDEYESLKARYRKRGQPLTRSALLERRRATTSRDARPAGRREPVREAPETATAAELRTHLEAAHAMLLGAKNSCDAARALGVVGRAATLVGKAMALLDAAAPAERAGG